MTADIVVRYLARNSSNVRETLRRARKLVVAVTTTALAVVLCAGAAVPGAAGQPSLAGWKLILPVSSSGCQCGHAAQFNPAAATPPWLVRNPDGSLTFWAPTKGASTPNSRHPRTELISLTGYRVGMGTHTLQETLSVQKLPSAQDVIIGQIHGSGASSAIPLLMLHYKQGSLVVATRNSPTTSGDHTTTVLTDVPLNEPFSFTITHSDQNILVSANHGSKQGHVTVPVPASFDNMEARFQAGDYQQTDANDSATDGGQLTVTALSQS